MLDEMLDAFAVWQKHIPNLKLFFLSKLSQSDTTKACRRKIHPDSVRVNQLVMTMFPNTSQCLMLDCFYSARLFEVGLISC